MLLTFPIRDSFAVNCFVENVDVQVRGSPQNVRVHVLNDFNHGGQIRFAQGFPYACTTNKSRLHSQMLRSHTAAQTA